MIKATVLMIVLLASGVALAGDATNTVREGPGGTTIHETHTGISDQTQVRKEVGGGLHVYGQGQETNTNGRQPDGSLGGTNPHNDSDKSGGVGIGTTF